MKLLITIQTMIIAMIMVASNAFADGFIIVPRHGGSGYHYPLSVSFHRVNVTIDNQMALTEIDQEFYNPGDSTIEGIYLFPVPQGAVIKKFSMFINGTERQAEVLDAEKARGIYERIVSQMRDPALMEYAGRDLFRARIYPIEAHSRKRVKISYQELIRTEDGSSVYTYPLNTEKFSSTLLDDVSISVAITSSRGIAAVLCPGYSVDVVRKDVNNIRLSYEERNVRPDRDFRVFYSSSTGPVSISMIGNPDGSGGGHFMLSISPQEDLFGNEPVEKDVVFVIDTSGSMIGDKMTQAKEAMVRCIKLLNPGDRFQIVRFSTEAEALFTSVTDVNASSRARAASFIEGLPTAGGTNMQDAIRLALEGNSGARPRYVLFITDGKPTIGETDEVKLLDQCRAKRGSVRIFTFGIGTDLNTHLLEGISSETGGSSRYITAGENIEKVVTAFFRKIQSPALTGIRLSFSGRVTVSDLQPSSLQDIFRGDALAVYGRYDAPGEITVSVEGNVGSVKRNFSGTFSIDNAPHGGDFIPRMWARMKIASLMEKIRLGGDDRSSVDEIVKLARTYGIVTPYTSYLILEDESAPTPAGIRESRDRTLSQAPAESLDMLRKEARGGAAGITSSEGEQSVSSAREIAKLKDGSASVIDEDKITGPAPLVTFIAGRAFYRSSWGWTEGRLANIKTHGKVSVRFLSDEYFELSRKMGKSSVILSLGSKIRFLMGGIIYEITE